MNFFSFKNTLLVITLALGSYLTAKEIKRVFQKPVNIIAFVDYKRALEGEQEAQKQVLELEEEERKLAEDEQKERVALEKEMQDYQVNSSKLSESARKEKEAKLSNKISMFQQQANQRGMALNNKKNALLMDLENKNKLLIQSLGKRHNIDVVIDMATVAFMSDNMKKNDITSDLIAEFNRAYPVKKKEDDKKKPGNASKK